MKQEEKRESTRPGLAGSCCARPGLVLVFAVDEKCSLVEFVKHEVLSPRSASQMTLWNLIPYKEVYREM
jgi:hypothetical protein